MSKQVEQNDVAHKRSSTRFIFTIDVESMSGGDPQSDIWGKLAGETHDYGITLLMDMLDEHQMRATFFLNVYEMAKYGEAELRDIAQTISARGHDVQLHTHPRPMYPFYGMSKAPLTEQILILKKGVELLNAWTHKTVVAHRAGAFAANLDTIRAVEAVGLKADCSLSAGSHVSVPLVTELGATNLVQTIGGILEIPVTHYNQIRLGPWHSRRILDLEGSSLMEIKYVTRWALSHQLPTICILMHSFSLCRYGKPNKQVIHKFTRLLTWLQQQPELRVCTVEEFCLDTTSNLVHIRPSGQPCTGIWMTWQRAMQSWREGWRNGLVAMVSVVGFVGIVVLMVYIWRAMVT